VLTKIYKFWRDLVQTIPGYNDQNLTKNSLNFTFTFTSILKVHFGNISKLIQFNLVIYYKLKHFKNEKWIHSSTNVKLA